MMAMEFQSLVFQSIVIPPHFSLPQEFLTSEESKSIYKIEKRTQITSQQALQNAGPTLCDTCLDMHLIHPFQVPVIAGIKQIINPKLFASNFLICKIVYHIARN